MSFVQVNTRIIFSSNRKEKTKRSCSLTYNGPESVLVANCPGTLLPVHVWNSSIVAFVPSLSFLSSGTLDPRLSLCSYLSVSTTWSLGPSFPRATQVSFGSISTRCPRGSWDTCHVCPHPGLSAIITRWTRLNRLPKIVKNKPLVALDSFFHLAFQTRWGSGYWFSIIYTF